MQNTRNENKTQGRAKERTHRVNVFVLFKRDGALAIDFNGTTEIKWKPGNISENLPNLFSLLIIFVHSIWFKIERCFFIEPCSQFSAQIAPLHQRINSANYQTSQNIRPVMLIIRYTAQRCKQCNQYERRLHEWFKPYRSAPRSMRFCVELNEKRNVGHVQEQFKILSNALTAQNSPCLIFWPRS